MNERQHSCATRGPKLQTTDVNLTFYWAGVSDSCGTQSTCDVQGIAGPILGGVVTYFFLVHPISFTLLHLLQQLVIFSIFYSTLTCCVPVQVLPLSTYYCMQVSYFRSFLSTCKVSSYHVNMPIFMSYLRSGGHWSVDWYKLLWM